MFHLCTDYQPSIHSKALKLRDFTGFSDVSLAPGPLRPHVCPMPSRPAPPHARVTALLGPTNTGKTHFAIERMLAHRSGMIGLPLRLLAREVYDRITRLKSPNEVALVTGEEKIIPRAARFWVCTVEAMPLDIRVA